jgi:hypothetical protein
MASRIVPLARNRSKSAVTLKRLAAYRAELAPFPRIIEFPLSKNKPKMRRNEPRINTQ